MFRLGKPPRYCIANERENDGAAATAAMLYYSNVIPKLPANPGILIETHRSAGFS
jgi:hypothetical protein